MQRFKQLTNYNGAIMRAPCRCSHCCKSSSGCGGVSIMNRDAMLLFCSGNCCLCTIDQNAHRSKVKRKTGGPGGGYGWTVTLEGMVVASANSSHVGSQHLLVLDAQELLLADPARRHAMLERTPTAHRGAGHRARSPSDALPQAIHTCPQQDPPRSSGAGGTCRTEHRPMM